MLIRCVQNLFAKFRNGAEPPQNLGQNRDYNVDLVPKFMMACGTYSCALQCVPSSEWRSQASL